MDRKTRDILRSNFPAFLKYIRPNTELARHHLIICDFLQRLMDGRLDRGLISMPPRHGKSFIISEAFPAFLLGNCAGGDIIMASYSADLTKKFGTTVKEIMRSERYQAVFPGVLPDDESKDVSQWKTTSKSVIKCAGVGGSLTGFGAGTSDLSSPIRTGLICDDLIKNKAESRSRAVIKTLHGSLSNDLLTRLLPNAFALVMGTRWTIDDAHGYLLRKGGWEYLNLEALYSGIDPDPLGRQPGDALWPEWYGRDKLLEIKANMSESDWNALYQGRPVSETGDIFDIDHFSHRHQDDGIYRYKILALDTASTISESSDFTVGIVGGYTGNSVDLLSCFRERLTMPRLIEKVYQEWKNERLDMVVVEKANSGISLSQMLEDVNIPVTTTSPRGSKYQKASAVSQYMSKGKIKLPAPYLYDGNPFPEMIEECLGFPQSPHDDFIDALNALVIFSRENLHLTLEPRQPLRLLETPRMRKEAYGY